MSRLTGDFLRVLAIMAVVTIHATHDKEIHFMHSHDLFSFSFLGIFLNQISRFSVPVFIMLSGYGLTKKYAGVAPDEINLSWAMEFYKKRFLKIGIPFFFWTVVLLVIFNRFNSAGSIFDILRNNSAVLLKYLFIQGADYHFYFFIIILECYIVYPLILKYKSPLLFITVFCIHMAYVFSVHFREYTGIALHRFPSSFLVYWLFYFYAGIIFSDAKIEKKIKSVPRFPLILLALAAMSHLVFEYVRRSYSESNPDYYNHFNRFSVLMYSLLIWSVFMAMDEKIEKFICSNNLKKIIILLSCLSFGVYIYHTMLLRLCNYILPGGSLAVVIFVIAVTFVAMMILDWIVRPDFARILAGLPDRLPEKPYFF